MATSLKEIAQDILTSTKEVIINIENEETAPMMDNMLHRFQYLAQGIFKEVDNENLAKCRKISKPWLNFIDNKNFYWKRRIEMYKGSMQEYNKQWKKVLKNTPVESHDTM